MKMIQRKIDVIDALITEAMRLIENPRAKALLDSASYLLRNSDRSIRIRSTEGLRREYRKIAMIKALRTISTWGLKEAKNAIDDLIVGGSDIVIVPPDDMDERTLIENLAILHQPLEIF
jgi:hypothetical protein